MAINDVSLTSGMRSNLLSLQKTVTLLDRTQTRLSSGKKVNTAIDNPVSYFASQALTSRASTIDSLKDAMGQAVQTITAADKGISAITGMIEQAKGIAQQAQTALDTQDGVKVTLNGVDNGATLQLDGITFTATTAAPADAATGASFSVGTNNNATAGNLASAINSFDWEGNAATYKYTATVSGGSVVIEALDYSIDMHVDMAVGDVTAGTGMTAALEAGPEETELASLQKQYNELRSQISALANDSGYKGKNLLTDDTLSVRFEGTTLNVTGFDATATGLEIDAAANWTVNKANIDEFITALDSAATTLRTEASKMSGNLSIITTRQEFSTNMINTLTEGSDKLTLADANEEGANMLMLQTRQSLSTTALSLSAQAAQSVLQLFG